MTIKITKKPPAPKTKRTPKHLSLDALGLLAHMRDHKDSDGCYSWGVTKTAEYFAIGNRSKIRRLYDELSRKHQTETIQSGKDPKTGKMLLLIVKPLGENPCARVNMETSPLEPSMCTGAPLDVIKDSTGQEPVSMGCNPVKTVDSMSAREHGPAAEVPQATQDKTLQKFQNALADAETKLSRLVEMYGEHESMVKIQRDRVAGIKEVIQDHLRATGGQR